ncbi:MAG TPA: glycoside hydrolase family 16 protein [Nocardioides sp.]|nr:glycoside hydrolase family 16 protein [Nocardioides sp.]
MRAARWALVVAMVIGLWAPGAPTAEAGRSRTPVLDRPATTSSTVVFAGRARARKLVRIQVRGAERWVTIRAVRANRAGRYRVAVPRPVRARAYRAVAERRSSVVRRVAARPVTPPPAVTPPPVVAPSDDCGVRPAKSSGGYWSCTFVDEFEGTSLDRSKWMVQETWFSGMTSGNHDCYVDSEQGIQVDSGVIRLTAVRELDPFTCASPFGSFTSTSTAATVGTRDRFTQTYGRFEFRARFPERQPGSHSALWLYPQAHTYGAWPASGEIDVAEWFGAAPERVWPSAHYAGEVVPFSSGSTCLMPTASDSFHTYAVEWSPTEMRFLYDGVQCWSHKWTPDGLVAPKPFDKPFYFVLTQMWGSLWNAPTDQTTTTSTLTVDWVRAWQ